MVLFHPYLNSSFWTFRPLLTPLVPLGTRVMMEGWGVKGTQKYYGTRFPTTQALHGFQSVPFYVPSNNPKGTRDGHQSQVETRGQSTSWLQSPCPVRLQFACPMSLWRKGRGHN